MNDIKNLTVYLGSSGRCRQIFKDTASNFGTLIGRNGKNLVYGGMDTGLMGIVANNALDAGAKVTGIIPKKLKDSERIHPDLTETILVPDLWERKLKMFKKADAIINLPGGFGTIDEALETLHWANLGIHNKPVIFLNTDGYWDDFIEYLETLPDLPKNFIFACDTEQHVFETLNNIPGTSPADTPKPDTRQYPHFEDEILQDTKEPILLSQASIKNSYYLATALGLKQLDKHQRPIGLLNDQGQFDKLLQWIESAQKEKFITDHCTKLFSVAKTMEELKEKMASQKTIQINLAHEKWGPSETQTHLQITEEHNPN